MALGLLPGLPPMLEAALRARPVFELGACFGADWVAPYDKNTQDLLTGPVSPNGDQIAFFAKKEKGRHLVVVNSVSSLVHVYSIGYMHGDSRFPRFFTYLNLFVFSMLIARQTS